ncbi:MAG: GNAT family N-acetyltransferase [Phycisphaerales bacterium]|nr:GNAT family N-acetyltransferase [Phycisphaerales bacterium]
MENIHSARLDIIPVTAAIIRADASNREALPGLLGARVPAEWPPALLADHLEEFARNLEADTERNQQHPFYWILREEIPSDAGAGGNSTGGGFTGGGSTDVDSTSRDSSGRASGCGDSSGGASSRGDSARRDSASGGSTRGNGAARRVLIGNGGFFDLGGGTWMIGYSMLEAYHNRGYATEAVAALVDYAFSHPSVATIVGTTFPNLIASIRVMEKNGFRYDGPGDEAGTIRYVLHRPAGGAGL